MAGCFQGQAEGVAKSDMTMIENLMEDFHIMDKTTSSSGLLGTSVSYVEGAQIKAFARKDNSIEAKLAEKQGVTEVYTVVVNKSVQLDFHDVIKRDSDGAIFRITGNITDNKAPDISTVPIAKLSAERWVLPSA